MFQRNRRAILAYDDMMFRMSQSGIRFGESQNVAVTTWLRIWHTSRKKNSALPQRAKKCSLKPKIAAAGNYNNNIGINVMVAFSVGPFGLLGKA